MIWQSLLEFVAYAVVGVLSFLAWWAVYEWVLTRGYSTRDAVFGRTPNPAVALDVAGGFVAMGVLNRAVFNAPVLESFWSDLWALALSLAATLVLLGVLRMGIAGGLRLWFGGRRDAQGDVVTLNNELFRQRNLATGLFSMALYGILVAGLVEQDFLNLTGQRLPATWNMLGTWAVGAVTVLLHSWLYLGLGGGRNILGESFDRNNPAAPLSLLGLLGGMLLLNHRLLPLPEPGAHLFALWELWAYLGMGLAAVVVLRGVLYVILRAVVGVRIGEQLLERRNVAWGVLDGALIFGLFQMITALIG